MSNGMSSPACECVGDSTEVWNSGVGWSAAQIQSRGPAVSWDRKGSQGVGPNFYTLAQLRLKRRRRTLSLRPPARYNTGTPNEAGSRRWRRRGPRPADVPRLLLTVLPSLVRVGSSSACCPPIGDQAAVGRKVCISRRAVYTEQWSPSSDFLGTQN